MALNLLKRIIGKENGAGSDLLLPADQFRTLILHECARCDRNAHEFSLIHVDLKDGDHNGKHKVEHLAKSLVHRMRTTDEIGWMDENSIGVFLPETGQEGAQRLASNACENFSYQIYTYPWLPTDLPKGGPGQRRDREDQSSAASSTMGKQYHQDSTRDSSQLVHPRRLEELLLHRGLPIWKRAFDIAGATVLLVGLSPLFVLVALYIKLVSRGSVFFRQERVGYLGRSFNIWKFRTMKMNADDDIHRSHLKGLINGDKVLTKLDQETDCRWIPLAGLLRKTCIDELPQLFNVLTGEMSLVGPRPVLYYEAEEYLLWQRQRFHAVPGMTGLWQVSGKNRLTFSQMMRLDARYSRKCNFLMDLIIFIKTVPAILGQVLDSLREKIPFLPPKKNVSVWRRSLNNLVRQVFL
jgi:lipopolysaccharide/colanic/teichoic acid biosynthesis glycosyltransferase